MQKYEGAKFHIEKRHLKPAAFDLHQTAEMLYHCILLVETFYTPHVHNLIFLRKQAERIDRRLVDAWPRETRADRARFEKLKSILWPKGAANRMTEDTASAARSEEHTSELQSLMRTSYAVF